jgi:hypothetical protein
MSAVVSRRMANRAWPRLRHLSKLARLFDKFIDHERDINYDLDGISHSSLDEQ